MNLKTARIKIERGYAMKWTRKLPHWLGPCRWQKLSRTERQDHLRKLASEKADQQYAAVIRGFETQEAAQ